jgi:hypothetical protein
LSKADPETLMLEKASPSTKIPKGTKAHDHVPSADDPAICDKCGATKPQHKLFGKDEANGMHAFDDDFQPSLTDLLKAVAGWEQVPDDDRTTIKAGMIQLADDLDAPENVVQDILNLPVPALAKSEGRRRKKIHPVQKGGSVPKLTDEQRKIIEGLPEDQRGLFASLVEDNDTGGGDTGDTKTPEIEGSGAMNTLSDRAVELALSKADPVTRTVLEKALNDADEARSIAKSERDLRVHAEMVEKARQFRNLQGTPEEKAEILKSAYGTSPEVGQRIENMMKAANAQLDDSGALLASIGKAAPGQQPETTSEVDARAKTLMEADSKLTLEQAKTAVFKADPKLYDEVRKESANGNR